MGDFDPQKAAFFLLVGVIVMQLSTAVGVVTLCAYAGFHGFPTQNCGDGKIHESFMNAVAVALALYSGTKK